MLDKLSEKMSLLKIDKLLRSTSWWSERNLFEKLFNDHGDLFVAYMNRYLNESEPEILQDATSSFLHLLERKGTRLTLSQLESMCEYCVFKDAYDSIIRSFRNADGSEKPEDLYEQLLPVVSQVGLDEIRVLGFCAALRDLYEQNKITYFLTPKELESGFEKYSKDTAADMLEKKLLGKEQPPSWSDILNMDGVAFEKFCEELYKKQGFQTQRTPITGDQGADLILIKEGKKTAVQIKQHSKPVGNKAVQEVVAAIRHYGCENGLVINSGDFTKAARELAKSNHIQLIGKNQLKRLIDDIFVT